MIPKHLAKLPRKFHGKRFDVVRTRVTGANGRTGPKDIVLHPGAVVILPLLDADTLVLIRNDRPAVGRTLWEIPAGTLEPGESTRACAGRELIEETGYRAGKITKLMTFFPSPGILSEDMHVYLARDLVAVGQDLDEGETITVHPTPWAKALAMIDKGTIRDGKTIAALLYYQWRKTVKK